MREREREKANFILTYYFYEINNIDYIKIIIKAIKYSNFKSLNNCYHTYKKKHF